jgi:hypothetical protein
MSRKTASLILDFDELPEAKPEPSLRDRLVKQLFEQRKARATHPEGTFDRQQRFYPSKRENADGDGTKVRAPSFKWPHSFMLRCRTREHCGVLVDRCLNGQDVPPDVQAVVRPTKPGPTSWSFVLQNEALEGE